MAKLIKKFFALESASAVLLLIATLLAIFCANTTLNALYQPFTQATSFAINEGLMTFFFLNVGLELKRGYLSGQLSSIRSILLPAIAALGGMLVPALIYCIINFHHPDYAQGWGIPVATDIAFAISIVALLGKRVPSSLRLFLLLLAIFDDIGAIVIIATFYTHQLNPSFLLQAGMVIFSLLLINHYKIQWLFVYALLGILLWLCLWKAGVHPTLTGVVLALLIPGKREATRSLVHQLEEQLHPWVAYCIMPLFAFTNAGLVLHDLSATILTDTLFLGIMAGLFIGKQCGVFLLTYGAIRLQLAQMPDKANWRHIYGIALLCGIGFTMSLFIGNLSFDPGSEALLKVRLAVLIGSCLSGMVGALVFLYQKECVRD